MNKPWRRLRNALLSLIAVLLILLASISALMETQTGSRWLVHRLAGLANISLGTVTGNLREGLDIASLEYRQEGVLVQASQLSFRWRPIDLFYSALMIDSLSAAQLRVQLPPAAQPEPPTAEPFSQWPSLRLPLRIQLAKLDLRQIRFQQGEQQLAWDKLSGDLSLGTFNLRYSNLTLIHPDYELRLTGRTALDYPYASSANLHWQWQAPAGADGSAGLLYRGVSQLDGDLTQLALANRIDSPVALNATASGALVNAQRELQLEPALQLHMEWLAQPLPAAWWLAEKRPPITRGLLKAEGNWQAYRASLEGAIQLPDTPALAVNTRVDGSLDAVNIQQLDIRELGERLQSVVALSSSAASSVAATAGDTEEAESSASTEAAAQVLEAQSLNRDAGLSLKGRVAWAPALDWQLAVEAKAFNLAGLIDNWPSRLDASFTSRGSLKDDHWQAALEDLALAGELRGVYAQGSGSVVLDGSNLRSDSLALTVGANQLQLKGELGDSLSLQWNINAPLLQQLDESITGSLISKGELRGDRNHPRIDLSASANKVVLGDYGVEKLELALVPLTAQSQPIVGPQPGSGSGQDSGAAPQLDNSAASSPVGAGLNPVRLLTGELLQERYQLNLSASRLQLAQQYFSSITMSGSGSVAKHELQATLRSPSLGRADIGLQGDYADYRWQGKLTQLALKLTKVPRWWLTSGQPIRISAEGVLLGEQCLTTRTNLTAAVERDTSIEREQLRAEWQPNQSPQRINPYDWLVNKPAPPASPIERYNLPRLCLAGDWSKSSGARLDAQLDAVPLRQFLSLFKTEVFFAGVMDGNLSLRSPDLTLAGTRASLDITTRNAELRYQYAGGVTDVYPWRDFAVRAQLQKSQLSTSAGMEWTGFGRMDLTSLLDLQQQTINNARLQVNFHNIAPLETLLPFTNDVKGELTADLSAGGSFSAPYLAGDIYLRNGSANLTRLGLDLQAVSLSLNAARDGQLKLMSEAQSGDGRLTLVGDLKGFGSDNWRAQAFVNGTNFRVVSLPQLKANLSPNIKVELDAKAMHLTGDAVIPWARTNIKSLPPSAVQVSDDALIVDEKFLQQQAVSPFEVFSNLNLSLGEDVSFKGFGLSSKLSGRLNLLKEANRPFFTNGYVSVSEGSYKAYGQTLTIERGRLAFQGPYDNPGLDIRATRTIRDSESTKVGLDIDGTLQRPKAKVFASPSKSDSEAMMMLLTGKPIKEASNADASLLLSAMSGLGMDSGGSITSEINRFFGVDQLEVKADDGIDQSQLWVGKYLTPKLLVRYVVGIFDQAFSFGIEYQLTDSFRIEAESGTTKSVDLIYKIER
jgi:translocation and assembly module TamB